LAQLRIRQSRRLNVSKLIKSAVIAGILASVPAPILAQGRRDSHRPQVSHAPAHPSYREVTVSRGHRWRRGQRLAVNQRRYVVNDWSQRGLRAPPRGYRWVRESNNSGDYILIAAATGLIASILSQ